MKECPTCGQPVPESARFCSICRGDFTAIDAAAEAEGQRSRAESHRAVLHFVLFAAAILGVGLLVLVATGQLTPSIH